MLLPKIRRRTHALALCGLLARAPPAVQNEVDSGDMR